MARASTSGSRSEASRAALRVPDVSLMGWAWPSPSSPLLPSPCALADHPASSQRRFNREPRSICRVTRSRSRCGRSAMGATGPRAAIRRLPTHAFALPSGPLASQPRAHWTAGERTQRRRSNLGFTAFEMIAVEWASQPSAAAASPPDGQNETGFGTTRNGARGRGGRLEPGHRPAGAGPVARELPLQRRRSVEGRRG